jgi:hypothetical protein
MSYIVTLSKVLRDNSHYKDALERTFNELCTEWMVIQSEYVEEDEECMCGKQGIHYINTIRNYYNNNILHPIGSVCIHKFGIKALNIYCYCCNKYLGNDNRFLNTYLKSNTIDKDSAILGHKKCIKKIFKSVNDISKYFLKINVKIIVIDNTIDLEYDAKYSNYIDMLCQVAYE